MLCFCQIRQSFILFALLIVPRSVSSRLCKHSFAHTSAHTCMHTRTQPRTHAHTHARTMNQTMKRSINQPINQSTSYLWCTRDCQRSLAVVVYRFVVMVSDVNCTLSSVFLSVFPLGGLVSFPPLLSIVRLYQAIVIYYSRITSNLF